VAVPQAGLPKRYVSVALLDALVVKFGDNFSAKTRKREF
jgi:hypothetical protein